MTSSCLRGVRNHLFFLLWICLLHSTQPNAASFSSDYTYRFWHVIHCSGLDDILPDRQTDMQAPLPQQPSLPVTFFETQSWDQIFLLLNCRQIIVVCMVISMLMFHRFIYDLCHPHVTEVQHLRAVSVNCISSAIDYWIKCIDWSSLYTTEVRISMVLVLT